VAILALEVCVFAVEGEPGLPGMIELRGFPTGGCMAAEALGPALATVNVIGCVAGHAGGRRALVSIAEVTLRAVDALVFVMQRKRRLVVIEFDLLPGPGVVAGGAIAAQLAFVRLLRRVAADTIAGGFPEFPAGWMATVAGGVRVRAAQRKIGGFVIEGVAAELHDVGAPTLVLDVTGAALRGFDSLQSAMKSLPRSHIGGDFLVAVEAQLPLAPAVAAVVAVGAVLLVLPVSRGQLAGHEKLFRVHGFTVSHRQEAQQNLHE
jgi:hypothetical protein